MKSRIEGFESFLTTKSWVVLLDELNHVSFSKITLRFAQEKANLPVKNDR